MGVKFAHAFGAETVLFTTSPEKVADGKRLGADEVVISKNADEMKKHERSFDLIINTVAVSHNLDPFISLLKRDGSLVLVGAPGTSASLADRLQPAHGASFPRRLGHRRDSRDAGNARLLCGDTTSSQISN